MLRNRSLARSALVVGWLVGTRVLLQGAFLLLVARVPPYEIPRWLDVSVASLALGHGSLVAVWGGWLQPRRFAAAYVVAVAGLLALGADEAPPNDMAMWLFVAAFQMVIAGVAMFGVESIDRPRQDEIDAQAAPRVWFQFSLGSLLSWTAGVAVVLAASHYVPRQLLELHFRRSLCG
jgi:hypothetical protein